MKSYYTMHLVNVMLVFATLGCGSCSKTGEDPVGAPQTVNTPLEGPRIAWDYSSMQRVSPQSGRSLAWTGYSRVRRLSDNSLVVSYEANGNVEMIRSNNKGLTWSEPAVIFEKHNQSNAVGNETSVNMSNGEFIELKDGTLLCACNYRPSEGGVVPYAIAVKRSTDNGLTWSEAKVIYEAGTYFHDGCWEPAFLELPSGEVQVYFANEGPFMTSDEQNISMLSSWDKGLTWSEKAVVVSFRAHHRDGMPVPVLINNEIVVAIEDNVSGQFKPYIVRTTLENNWNETVSAGSEYREPALEKAYPDQTYAGAPYLLQMNNGYTLLSYQTTYKRGSNWELSTMEVAVGDTDGRHFGKQSRPFAVPMDKEAKWNAVATWDEHTVVATSTTNFQSHACEVWLINGYVIPPLKLETADPVVDGHITHEEWGRLPLFVGHTSHNRLWAGVKRKAGQLVFAMQFHADESQTQQPEFHLLIDPDNSCTGMLSDGLIKCTVGSDGVLEVYKGSDKGWKITDREAFSDRIKVSAGEGAIEFSVPEDILETDETSTFRINVGVAYINANGEKVTEWIANSTEEQSFTWCSVRRE